MRPPLVPDRVRVRHRRVDVFAQGHAGVRPLFKKVPRGDRDDVGVEVVEAIGCELGDHLLHELRLVVRQMQRGLKRAEEEFTPGDSVLAGVPPGWLPLVARDDRPPKPAGVQRIHERGEADRVAILEEGGDK